MLGVNARFWVKRRHCGSLNGGYVADMVTPTKHDGDTLTKADQTRPKMSAASLRKRVSKRLRSRTLPPRSTASATTHGASRSRNFSRTGSSSARTGWSCDMVVSALCQKRTTNLISYSITSQARASSDGGISKPSGQVSGVALGYRKSSNIWCISPNIVHN